MADSRNTKPVVSSRGHCCRCHAEPAGRDERGIIQFECSICGRSV